MVDGLRGTDFEHSRDVQDDAAFHGGAACHSVKSCLLGSAVLADTLGHIEWNRNRGSAKLIGQRRVAFGIRSLMTTAAATS